MPPLRGYGLWMINYYNNTNTYCLESQADMVYGRLIITKIQPL